jgi:hypothetical protein
MLIKGTKLNPSSLYKKNIDPNIPIKAQIKPNSLKMVATVKPKQSFSTATKVNDQKKNTQ